MEWGCFADRISSLEFLSTLDSFQVPFSLHFPRQIFSSQNNWSQKIYEKRTLNHDQKRSQKMILLDKEFTDWIWVR